MKLIGSNIRFIALSATVPNSGDLAIWLGRSAQDQNTPAREEHFGEEFRPVKLEKHVYGYNSPQNDFIFEKTLLEKLPEVVQKHSSGKPVMVFCPTRKSCSTTAKLLAEKWQTCKTELRPWPEPNSKFSFIDKELQSKCYFH